MWAKFVYMYFFSSLHLSEAVLCKLYKEQNRPIAKTILVAFSESHKATLHHLTVQQQCSDFRSKKLGVLVWHAETHFSGQLKSTLTVSHHPTLHLGIFQIFSLYQRTKGASCRIIPQLQLWARLNSWRNGKGHLMSFRYSHRQPLSTADTRWDHDL